MFDGEESNELESNKDKDIEEGNTGSINASSNDEEAKRTEEIELDVLKKPQSESSETKYGDEENTSEKENSSSGNTNDNANGNTNDNAVSCNPANPVRTILEEADDYELEEGEVRFLPIGTEPDTLEVMFLILHDVSPYSNYFGFISMGYVLLKPYPFIHQIFKVKNIKGLQIINCLINIHKIKVGSCNRCS